MINIFHQVLGSFVTSRLSDSVPATLFQAYKAWFLHASDAVWFTSHMLHHDTCSYYRTLPDLSSMPLNVSILQRRDFRVMLNVNDVQRNILDSLLYGYNGSQTQSFEFEAMDVIEQAQRMFETDLLITIHGAGETNIAFMKPCSIGKLFIIV
jgi:hypothetical protein